MIPVTTSKSNPIFFIDVLSGCSGSHQPCNDPAARSAESVTSCLPLNHRSVRYVHAAIASFVFRDRKRSFPMPTSQLPLKPLDFPSPEGADIGCARKHGQNAARHRLHSSLFLSYGRIFVEKVMMRENPDDRTLNFLEAPTD